MSDKASAQIGTNQESFLGSSRPPNSAMDAIGVKFGGCGISRDSALATIRKIV